MRGSEALTAVLLVIALLFSTAVQSSSYNLPDTGQTQCYRTVDEAQIPCARTGQDGGYSINPMSFTDNGDGTVTDDNTGLTWQQRDDGFSYNWYQASGTYDATYNPTTASICGSLSLAGHTDWRIPAQRELLSIVDYSLAPPGPTIQAKYFPNAKAAGYWSATPYAFHDDGAWRVVLVSGHGGPFLRADSNYVRCVRGDQLPGPALTDNGDGTVTDSSTGLIWQQGEPGRISRDEALSYCEGLELRGSSDWRLPNIKEIGSLIDYTGFRPAIDASRFPNAYSDAEYWSSTNNLYFTLDSNFPLGPWAVWFAIGNVTTKGGGGKWHTRCVSGGEPRTASSVLWTNGTTGQAALWTINPSTGAKLRALPVGPLAGIGRGWQATDHVRESDETGHVLWSKADSGRAVLWTIDLATGARQRAVSVGPSAGIGSGWMATGYVRESDEKGYVLWTRAAAGKAVLWTIDPSTGAKLKAVLVGSSAGAGWKATAYVRESNTNGHVLWTNATAGKAAVWTIDVSTGAKKRSVSVRPQAGIGRGWQATDYVRESETKGYVLWANGTSGKAALWTFNPSTGAKQTDVSVGSPKGLGPGFQATGLE